MDMGTGAYKDTWVDVIERHEQYKETFNLPTEDDLSRLEANDSVKISNGFERFFVQVQRIEDNTVIGRVMNHLIGSCSYGYQDQVSFEKRHIFMIHKRQAPNQAAARQKRVMRMLGLESKEANALRSILDRNR